MSIQFVGAVPVPPTQPAPLRVLITGASRGIGFELVRQYAQAHAENIVFAAVRDPNSATSAAVVALAAKHPNNIHIVTLDVGNEQSIRKSASFVTPLSDHLDVLINNAGIIGETNPLTVTTEQLTTVFHTNVAGPLIVIQTFLPLLKKSSALGDAKVIQVSTGLASNELAFLLGAPLVAYGISKAGLNYMNTVLRHVVPDVTFLTISPGWVATDMGNAVAQAPVKVEDSVQAIRYYVATKGIQNSGDFLDVMTGKIISF